jgi:hypothetical protein
MIADVSSMDLTSPGITYVLLVIPTLIALAVFGQGVAKVFRKEPDGAAALVFGLMFFGFVAAAYFYFIR